MYFPEKDEAPERPDRIDRKLETLDMKLQNYGNRLERLQRQLEQQLIDNTPKHRRWLMRLRLFVRRWVQFFKDR